MRRALIVLAALGFFAADAGHAFAQQRSQRQQQRQEEIDKNTREDARKQLDREEAEKELPVPELANSGPCPFVKVLYDASRVIEFAGVQKASNAVTFSGEIEGLVATCRYKANEPIVVETRITFALGKGPQATGPTKDYGYWVAVTDRNRTVLAKEHFTFTAGFPAGADRVLVYQHLANIVIPRANDRVSGENFEVLIGFDVTPEMAEFNRLGTRFVVNAGQNQTVRAGTQ